MDNYKIPYISFLQLSMCLLYRIKPEHKLINHSSREELNIRKQKSGVRPHLSSFLVVAGKKPESIRLRIGLEHVSLDEPIVQICFFHS